MTALVPQFDRHGRLSFSQGGVLMAAPGTSCTCCVCTGQIVGGQVPDILRVTFAGSTGCPCQFGLVGGTGSGGYTDQVAGTFDGTYDLALLRTAADRAPFQSARGDQVGAAGCAWGLLASPGLTVNTYSITAPGVPPCDPSQLYSTTTGLKILYETQFGLNAWLDPSAGFEGRHWFFQSVPVLYPYPVPLPFDIGDAATDCATYGGTRRYGASVHIQGVF